MFVEGSMLEAVVGGDKLLSRLHAFRQMNLGAYLSQSVLEGRASENSAMSAKYRAS
jgi:hypothetical protein